jgi:predicted membrane protein
MLKNNLAPFFINNFYINYLTGDFLENNLLYIITMLLQHELDKINKIEEWKLFLEKSKSNVGIFLTSLREVPNIQLFFQNVINRAVEKLEKHNIMDDLFINEEEKSNIAESSKKHSVYKKVKKDNIEWNDKNVEKINHNCQIFEKNIQPILI